MALKNMISFYCFFLFSLSFSQIPIKQEFKLIDGQPYDTKKEEHSKGEELITKDFFCYKGKAISIKIGETRHIYYQMYDVNRLTHTNTKTILRKDELPRKYFPEGAVQKGDTVFCFYNDYKRNQGIKFFLQKICISTGEVSALEMLFYEEEFVLHKAKKRLRISTCTNGNFLITYNPVAVGKKDVVCFVICDSSMNVQWRKKLKMPYRKDLIAIKDVVYNKNNELIILVHNYMYTKDVFFEIWKLNEADEEKSVIEFECSEGDRFIQNIRFKEGLNGNFFIAGFVGELSLANGFYIGEFDSNGENIKDAVNKIPLKIINEYNFIKIQKKNLKREEKGVPVGIQGLSLTDFTLNADGTVVLHGEAYSRNGSVNYASIAAGGIPMASSEHFYQSMFAAKIDASGKIVWMNKMPKNQLREEGGPGAFHVLFAAPKVLDLSYNYLHTKNYHYFVFMDHEKNFNLAIDEFPVEHGSGNRGVLMAYRINDESGELNKLHLFNSRDTRGMMLEGYLTKNLTSIDDNEFFIEMHKKKKEDVLLKIELED